MMKKLLFRIFATPAQFAGALSLLMLPVAAPSAFAQDLLSGEIKQALSQTAARIEASRPTGQRYLRETGLNLVVVIPSMETMLAEMRKAHAAGELDKKSLQAFEQVVEAAPLPKRRETKYQAVGPGFEPSTALPRPFGVRMQDGSMLIVSDKFMQRFQVTTRYDLQRIIRNASIMLTDFGAGVEHDNFQNHHRRLVQFLGSGASLELGLGERSYVRDVFLLTAALMAFDHLFLAELGAPLPADDHYVAAVIVGHEFQLFK